jgi:hypothetical protein
VIKTIIASVNSEKNSFVLSFRKNDQINSEKVVAKMGQRILKVTRSKKEQTKPEIIKIEIKS